LGDVVLDEPSLLASPMLPYARMVVRLVEGIPLSLAELVSLLREALRQHSIVHRRRTDYALQILGRQLRRPPRGTGMSQSDGLRILSLIRRDR
jgi:hypothetical protein